MTERPAPIPAPPEFVARAAALGIEFEPGDVDRLGQYLALLLEANALVNLTAITEPGAMWHRHVLDAVALMPLLAALEPDPEAQPATTPPRLIDVGTGGGVPGIPLAIAMPGWRVALLEPTGRKAEFLHRAVAALGLDNVSVYNARAERLGHDREHRESYDAAVVRAVGPLSVIAELCLPLVRQGGLMLAVKGEKAPAELEAARPALALLGGVPEQIAPTPTAQVVVVSKGMRTPRTYPRADGEPKRRPLGAEPPVPAPGPRQQPTRRTDGPGKSGATGRPAGGGPPGPSARAKPRRSRPE